MKKVSILAFMAALGIMAGSLSPAQTVSAAEIFNKGNIKGYVINGGKIENLEDLGENFKSFYDKLWNMSWNNCPKPDKPNTEKPETNKPETDKPNTEKPNKPETDKPETEALTYAEQVVRLVNIERTKAGLSELTLDKKIESAALVRAKEIEKSFSHTRPDGRHFSTVLKDNGISYKGAGENIAWGQKSPEEVVKGWMNSEGHRANILNSKFTKIGVGHYQNVSGRNFWTQIFTY